MHADRPRHRLRRRAPRLTTTVAALAALALALAALVAGPRHALADPVALTVTPAGLVVHDGGERFVANVQTGSGGDMKVSVNGEVRFEQAVPANASWDVELSELNFRCDSRDNSVRVDVGGSSQTVTGLVLICPELAVTPRKVAGTDPVTVTVSQLSGFDTLGPEQGPKTLYFDGSVVGTFGYGATPRATVEPRRSVPQCGTHTIRLSQPSPYGTVDATAELQAWCSDWSVTPHGLDAPQASDTVTVSGTPTVPNLPCDQVQVYLDDQSVPIATATPDATGRYSATFADGGYFHTNDEPGEHTIHIRYHASTPIHFLSLAPTPANQCVAPYPVDDSVPFYLMNPQISVGPAEVDRGALPYRATVTLSGFDEADDVYGNRNLQPKTLWLDGARIGTTGSQQWTGALNPPCGASTLRVTQPTGLGTATAAQTLTVLCPQLSLSPDVIARSAEPRTVTLRGRAFHRSWVVGGESDTWPYVVTLDGARVGAGDTDAAGALTARFGTGELSCGRHDVTVTEQPPTYVGPLAVPATPAAAVPAAPDEPQSVSTLLVVDCPSVGHPATGPTTLSVDPSVVMAGMAAWVSGTGFTPGQPVTLTWHLAGDVEQAAACPAGPVAGPVAGPDGTFLDLCVVAPGWIGPRTLTADDGRHTAGADALVVADPMQPSGSGRTPRVVIRQ